MAKRRLDAALAAAAAALFGACATWRLFGQPAWVGDGNDDAGYFLIARNLWRYGQPVIDSSGAPLPSTVLAPGLPLLLAPVSWLPLDAAVRAETLEVALFTAVMVVLAYVWMRACAGLPPWWALAGSALVATGAGAVGLGTGIRSDTLGVALVLGGVVLLSRWPSPSPSWVRLGLGFACLVAALVVRRLDVVVLGVAAAWALVALRGLLRARVTAVAGLVVGGGVFALIPSDSGTAPFLQADLEGPAEVPVGLAGLATRVFGHLVDLGGKEFAQPVISAVDSQHLRAGWGWLAVLVAVLFCLVAVAGLAAGRRWLELSIGGAVLAVALVWPFDPYRFMFPIAIFGVGGMLVLLRRVRVPAPAVFGGVLVLLAGNLQQVAALTPGAGTERARVAHLRALYEWEAANVPSGAVVLTWADLQSYVYSGHPATRDRARFVAGNTYVLGVPYGSVSRPGTDLDAVLVDSFSGPVVYSDGKLRVRRADAAT